MLSSHVVGLVYDVVAAAGAERKEDAGDELDPLADDCAGFLQDNELSSFYTDY